jgi:hypothetical protein
MWGYRELSLGFEVLGFEELGFEDEGLLELEFESFGIDDG